VDAAMTDRGGLVIIEPDLVAYLDGVERFLTGGRFQHHGLSAEAFGPWPD
jgi:hypothetical protein